MSAHAATRRPQHGSPSRPPRYELHIEEVVLEGFDSLPERALRTAIEQELTRLFRERGGRAGGRDLAVDRVDAGAFQATNVRAAPLGASIANAVFDGLPR